MAWRYSIYDKTGQVLAYGFTQAQLQELIMSCVEAGYNITSYGTKGIILNQ